MDQFLRQFWDFLQLYGNELGVIAAVVAAIIAILTLVVASLQLQAQRRQSPTGEELLISGRTFLEWARKLRAEEPPDPSALSEVYWKCIDSLERAVVRGLSRKDRAYVWLMIGEAYDALGYTDNAIAACSQAVKQSRGFISPEGEDAHYHRALLHEKAGHYYDAFEDFRISFMKRPTRDAYEHLKVCYMNCTPSERQMFDRRFRIGPRERVQYVLLSGVDEGGEGEP